MSRSLTVVSDREWGELACYETADEHDAPFIIHGFAAQEIGDSVVVVFASSREHIREVSINDLKAEPIETRFNRLFLASGSGPMQVRITLNLPTTTVFVGLFRRLREKVKELKETIEKQTGQILHGAIQRVRDKCLLCKLAVRAAIEAATGGANLAGASLDAAFEELADKLGEWVGDTLLGDVLDVVRSAINPGRLVAAEVCRRLGYCS